MDPKSIQEQEAHPYVGTLVGDSTSREFRLAVAHETIREQDIIAVDAELRSPVGNTAPEEIRVWAKVQRIERTNPLFPQEAGHELAATRTDPLDTVLSLSREMVTAVCQVLGAEPINGRVGGKLDHLRYPPQPASSAYRPDSDDIARVVLGELQERETRSLDIAHLSNRPEVDAKVDGHAIVSRHLAILAMTGAGKSWTARRIIEQLANKHYPIVIFDPHGDYTGIAEVPGLQERAKLFYADLPVLDEDVDTARQIIAGLSGEDMSPPQQEAFETLFTSASRVLSNQNLQSDDLKNALQEITSDGNISRFGIRRDLFALASIAQAVGIVSRKEGSSEERQQLADLGISAATQVSGRQTGTYSALTRQLRRAAFGLREMQRINRLRAGRAEPLPSDRANLVQYNQISVISLAGYTEVFQATLYSLIARHLFQARVQGLLPYPYLMLLEEAHNFVPGRAEHSAVQRSIETTKQIAQEGRKFGVGLVLISQRPSRLDETTLSQCNSYIIMRMVNPADQNFVRRVIETLGEDDSRMLPDLDVGEAILSGQFINFPVLVRMKEPESKGEREEQDAFEALEEVRQSANSPRR